VTPTQNQFCRTDTGGDLMRTRSSRTIDRKTSAYAIVAGCELNGLGVLRALGRAQVPSLALDTDLSRATAATRFGKKVAVRALWGPLFVEDLVELRSRFEKPPVLLLTQELSVATISDARSKLENMYCFTMPDHSIMSALLNKQRFQEMAERLGLRIARSVRLTEEGCIDHIRTLRFPCILKPAVKNRTYDEQFAKAYKLNTDTEVADLWSRMRYVAHEAILQEWIEGGDSEVFFCLQYRYGTYSPFSFVGRKVCQWPPGTGGTASCIPAPEVAPELIALTNSFFEAVGFCGICSMEFKRDARDQKFYLIEPTVGRTDYQEEIAALNGVNIPLALYRGELGEPPPEVDDVTPPRGWYDRFGYAKARAAGSPDRAQALLPGVKMLDAYFRIGDPMPYIALAAGSARRRIARIVRARHDPETVL
jgi:D-aspartate ligase